MPAYKLLAIANSISRDENSEQIPTEIKPYVVALRALKAEYNFPLEAKPKVVIKPKDSESEALLKANPATIKNLANFEEIQIDPQASKPKTSAATTVNGDQIFLSLNLVATKELEQTKADLEKVEKYLAETEAKLQDENFLKANQGLIAGEKAVKEMLINWRKYLLARLENLSP